MLMRYKIHKYYAADKMADEKIITEQIKGGRAYE